MRLQIFPGKTDDLAFVAIAQFLFRFVKRQPKGAFDLDAHLWSDVIHVPRLVAEQVETDDLEDALVIAPGADVNVFDIGELGNRNGMDPGFFAHLAKSSLLGLFAGVDQTLWQRK